MSLRYLICYVGLVRLDLSYLSVFMISLLFPVFEMAWFARFNGRTNQDLVEYLRTSGIIKTERVYEAMSAVDRGHYVRSGYAYFDAPQQIGYGATISAPHMHAYALEILEEKLFNGARALDVGSGSGYLTACMALMTGPNGLVIGIEHIPELNLFAIENIKKDNPELFEYGRIQFVDGDGRLGFPQQAPYDAIHVGAAAKELPHALIDQLAVGGRMVLPVGSGISDQMLIQVDKIHDGSITQKPLTGVAFVPLTSRDNQYYIS
ncbi:protein-L-isoaspartate(D-aspartate) O-methyltransferase-like isoform X1 [Apis laboriosa]|uniref:protein-L-isoaspartate(D-aspartate) O-methyltransferase-like isoform X1 n=3 Tax=Apis laboriosa TaxID=183418 RepID=UPI001CC33F1E|nr:protein-L-isoaspartate(D-aspartate) O-methyltransferase-like isoform X1 [Apis laboriosa]